MAIIVQKFGGTSVADTEKISAAARKAIRAQQAGNKVVVVVSAMGKNTDMLVELAGQITDRPSAREMDVLLSTGEQVTVALMAMAIHALGHQAVSMTGGQMGIKTDSSHTKARIRSISSERIHRALDDGKIVIAAGFQGIDDETDITTLGRGGSDTTAVALAAVLEAEACEIHTDVDGVYTTDPRQLPEARRVSQISYDEMLELASLGAGVMHSRAVEFGKRFSVPIHVRSSFTDEPGSMIVAEPEAEGVAVGGAAVTKNEALITISGVPDNPGTSYTLFKTIADQHIAVDMIVQNIGADGVANLSFTVLEDDLEPTLEAVEKACGKLGSGTCKHYTGVSKVSVVGLGMAEQTGVADQMSRALGDADVNMLMITTGNIKISALVRREDAQRALSAVHASFDLHTEPPNAGQSAPGSSAPAEPRDTEGILERLQHMEELTIHDVALDESQARVTISGVPDEPGIAARVFEEVSAGGVFVDMIVQNYRGEGSASLSWTVPKTELDTCVEIANRLAKELNCAKVTSSPAVAKVSVSGIGLRSHTGVAITMFKALADANINLDLINTSEVRVNALVDGAAGKKALAALESAFADMRR